MPAAWAAPTFAVKGRVILPPAGITKFPQSGAVAPTAGVVVTGVTVKVLVPITTLVVLTVPPFSAIAPVAAYVKPAGNASLMVTPVAGQLPTAAVLVTVMV